MTKPVRIAWPPLETLLFAGLALMLTFLHALDVELRDDYVQPRAQRHAEILDHTGKDPYVYRLLAPELAEAGRQLLGGAGVARDVAPEKSYLALHFAATLAGLLLFRRVLDAFVPQPWGLAGTLLFAALHPASYRYFWFQPDSPIDLALWLLAAWLAVRGKSGLWLIPLTAVGVLNRETVIFAPLIYGALAWDRVPRRRVKIECSAALITWAAVYLGLRLWIGPKERVVSVTTLMHENLGDPSAWLYAGVFFGLLWILPVLRWRRASPALKRLTLVLIPSFLPNLVLGRVREVRLFLPLSLCLIPHLLEELRARTTPTDGDAPPAAPRSSTVRGRDDRGRDRIERAVADRETDLEDRLVE